MAVDYAPDQAKQAARERFRGVWAAVMAADLEAAGLPVDRAGALAAG